MSPKSEAIAFRMWAFATPLGWNTTILEVAEHLEVSESTVRIIARTKGWLDRFRKHGRDVTEIFGRGGPVPKSWGEGPNDREIINHIEREFVA